MDTITHSRASRGRSWLGALLMASLGHSPIAHAAVAESDRIAALEQKLDQRLQLIRQLSARVQALEAQPQTAQSPGAAGVRRVAAAAVAPPAGIAPAPAGSSAPPATLAQTAQRLAQVQQKVHQMAANGAPAGREPDR